MPKPKFLAAALDTRLANRLSLRIVAIGVAAVALFWLQACGESPFEPGARAFSPQFIVVTGGNVFVLTISANPDTVTDAAMDTIELIVVIDSIVGCPGCVFDSVQMDLRATFQPDSGGPPVQVDYKNFLINESPNEFFGYAIGNPGDTLGVEILTDIGGIVQIPMTAEGVIAPGIITIDVTAIDGRFEIQNSNPVPVPIAVVSDCPPEPWFQDPSVIDSLRAMWQRSNPGAPQDQRVEQAGWIRETAGGYQFIPIIPSTQGACEMFIPIAPPDSVRSFTHTHVFGKNEVIQAGVCDPEVGIHTPGPSDDADVPALGLAKEEAPNDNPIGNILDPDGIWTYDAMQAPDGTWVIDPNATQKYGTCGVIN